MSDFPKRLMDLKKGRFFVVLFFSQEVYVCMLACMNHKQKEGQRETGKERESEREKAEKRKKGKKTNRGAFANCHKMSHVSASVFVWVSA